MSLGYYEPENDLIEKTVACCECGKEETKWFKGSTTLLELECYTCENCSDPITIEKYRALCSQYYGVPFLTAFVEPFFADFLVQNMNEKAISIYEHIQNLNLNDGK